MKSVSIKVDEEFHRCMKLRATEKGKSIKEYVVGLIEKDLETKKNKHMPSKAKVFVLSCETSEMHLTSMCIVTCFYKKVKF